MSNEELYKSTLNKVHVPKAVLGKVGEMNKERKTMRRRYVLQYAAYAIVMGGNIICCYKWDLLCGNR